MVLQSSASGQDGMADRGLVELVLEGDHGVYADLYRAHVRVVTMAVRDNVHDPDSVADVVQEVFARALERLGTLRNPERFRPWILSIARHAAVDHRRASRRSPIMLDHEVDAPAEDAGPDAVVERNELATLVRLCATRLSPRDATALTLVAQLGFTSAEIGQCLWVSTSAAKVIVHRARQRLREAGASEMLLRGRGELDMSTGAGLAGHWPERVLLPL